MRIVVLGAGLAGVTSAWYLRQAGHEVTVLERQPGPALETSYANGGQISVSHPEPWASPQAARMILRWLGREDAPLKFRPQADWRQWAWGLRFLRECLPGRHLRHGAAIAHLALASRAALRALRTQLALDYDCATRGILHLAFAPEEVRAIGARARWLRGFGMAVEECDAARCRAIEPALAGARAMPLGGLYAREDESGDAHRFVQGLATACAAAGVQLRYDSPVEALERAGARVTQARLRDGTRVAAEAFVLCLGSYSTPLVAPLGLRLPIYPVKGYSLTLSVDDDAQAPQVSLTDESHRIVVSRLGTRLRVAGTAELNGYDTTLNERRCTALLERTRALFPGLRAHGPPQYWTGLRPATPSNLPFIGASRVPGLYLNTGHGTLGWTLACGSAQALAQLIDGRRPDIDFPFLGID